MRFARLVLGSCCLGVVAGAFAKLLGGIHPVPMICSVGVSWGLMLLNYERAQ